MGGSRSAMRMVRRAPSRRSSSSSSTEGMAVSRRRTCRRADRLRTCWPTSEPPSGRGAIPWQPASRACTSSRRPSLCTCRRHSAGRSGCRSSLATRSTSAAWPACGSSTSRTGVPSGVGASSGSSRQRVELGLYTDSVKHLSFEGALDLAAEIGARGIEIAVGGQSSAPHLRIHDLLSDAARRKAFADAFSSRGLRIAALNCSAWPLHPVLGEEHTELIRATIRLASELEVSKIVTMSGNPGDGPHGSTVNWIWYPWPPDAVALLERQWQEAIPLWRDLGAYALVNGVERIAFELHPLHLVYNVPTLQRMREAVGPVIGANVDPV